VTVNPSDLLAVVAGNRPGAEGIAMTHRLPSRLRLPAVIRLLVPVLVAGASLLGNAATEPDIALPFGVQIGTLSAPVIAAGDEGRWANPASDVGRLRQMPVPRIPRYR
jgi:hypothetical protein